MCKGFGILKAKSLAFFFFYDTDIPFSGFTAQPWQGFLQDVRVHSIDRLSFSSDDGEGKQPCSGFSLQEFKPW